MSQQGSGRASKSGEKKAGEKETKNDVVPECIRDGAEWFERLSARGQSENGSENR